MKNLKNLGKALSKAEQKSINGGFSVIVQCYEHEDCRYGKPDSHDLCLKNRCVRV